jgi:hypothetical protein
MVYIMRRGFFSIVAGRVDGKITGEKDNVKTLEPHFFVMKVRNAERLNRSN